MNLKVAVYLSMLNSTARNIYPAIPANVEKSPLRDRQVLALIDQDLVP